MVLETKRRIGSNVELWADIFDRTGTPLGQISLEEAEEQAINKGKSDVLILTGKNYEESIDMIKRSKKRFPNMSMYLGGGCNAANLAETLQIADGVFVASCLKEGGSMNNPLDEKRLAEFLAAVKAL